MYHHRYQPPTNLANKTAAFASHNYPNHTTHSSSSSSSAANNRGLANSRSHFNNQTNRSNHHSSNNSSSSSSYPYASNNRSTEDRQDVIFRKVRGILNKITPETFDKLSKELVNVGLDSPRTLRGVIYLLFDKALKDLKYSSLYAKLCQELSEKAPNFEVEPGPNTFCKFLISKCEDEFERRRRATEDFDRKNDLTDEEFEQRAIAKQKMLGNIKFICELGKKRLLQEEILHECIRGLLSKKKERSIQDQAQDLECLSQIMRTIGNLLDIQASRNLMNQYFERIDMFSKKPELPSRIRFMLRDVMDLRNNKWRPRPFQREDNVPQPLSKLREEAGYDPTSGSSNDKFGNNRNLIGISDLSKLHGNKLSLLLDDEPSFTTSTDFHWGPSYMPLDNPFDPFSMGPTTNKSTQKLNTISAGPSYMSKSQPNTQTEQKSSNFKVHDPFPEPVSNRGLDSRPSFTRTNIVNQQRPSNDFGRHIDPVEGRQRPSVMNTHGDVEAPATSRTKQPCFAPYNPPAIRRDDPTTYDEPRRLIESRPAQQTSRGQIAQQQNRLINRHPDNRDFVPPPLRDGNHPAQDRLDRHEKPTLVPNDSQFPRDRRLLHQDNNQEQNSRFSNNYRSDRLERAPRVRENYQFERSNESETNQNWRAGPPSSASSVTSRHSSNPPPSVDSSVNHRSNSKYSEADGQERQTFGQPRNFRTQPQPTSAQPQPTSTSPIRPSPIQLSALDRGIPKFMIATQESTDSSMRRNTPRSDDILPKAHEPRSDHSNRTLSRHPEGGRHSHSDRRLNISPPRPRIYDSGPKHQVSTQQNFGPPSHLNARQFPRSNHADVPEQSDLPQMPLTNQSYRKVILTASNDATQNETTGKNFNSNDIVSPIIDRRFKPPSKNNNPPLSSDIQDPDRVSNWRKGGSFGANSQAAVKAPTKEAVKTQLNTSILPRPFPKISDTNFSLRPSHNLVSARTSIGVSKPITVDDAPLSNIVPQTEASKGLAGDQSGPSNPNVSDVDILVTNGSSNKDTHSKSARDFHVNKFISALTEHSNEDNCNINRIACKVKELKIPRSYQPDCLVSAMKQSIFKSENDRENTRNLLTQLLPNIFESAALLNAFKIIFEQLQALEAEIPKVKSLVAEFLSQAILDGLLGLDDVSGVLSGGRHHPLFLLCLQKLEKHAGQAWLNEKFMNTKIDLMSMLPEVDRSKDRLASVLKDRCLGFLDPMLTIEPDLLDQMKDKDSSPASIYRWIKDNVSPTIQGTSIFAHVLVTCLVRYIHSTSAERMKSSESKGEENPQSNKSSPSSASQGTADMEKELLSKYQQVLQAVLKDKHMQLATLYSLQSFYHGLDFPKGALLRWFHQMYDLNIVDDDVFFIWKEEINDKFPGKGQALFQVNTWLNWLAEAESEEEDEV